MPWHPDPSYEEDSLFISGSYGVDYCHAGDGLKTAPREGWAIMTVIREAELVSIEFGDDVSGASKLVGQTLLIGTTIWAHILSLELASGVVELKRGRMNPDASLPSEQTVEAESYTETWMDGSQVVVHWTLPSVTFTSGEYRIYRDGALIATVGSAVSQYADTNVSTGITYEYQVLFVYMS